MTKRSESDVLTQIWNGTGGARHGGLDDTIEEWNAEKQTGTGFNSKGLEPVELLAAIDRALEAFQDEESWRILMRNGMARDHGWAGPAREYAAVYAEAARRRA